MKNTIKRALPILVFPVLVLVLLAADGCYQLWQDVHTTGCRAEDLPELTDTWFAPQTVSTTAGEEQKLVCLTFDDGPSKTTEQVLEVLQTEQVPATFFVIAAQNNEKYLPLIQKESEAGCQVALHSGSHEYKTVYANTEAFWQDLEQLKAAIQPYVDTESIHCMRFPGGSTNTVSKKYGGSSIMQDLKQQAEERGYRYIDWNVCADDTVGKHKSAAQVYEHVIEDVGDKAVCVVLMHDTAATGSTAEALPDIIQWFRQRGYRFCTVDEMVSLTEMAVSGQE